MINAGAYLPDAPRPLSVLGDASFATFAEPDFPNWCTHCAFSNRGYLRRSSPYFLLEGWSTHRRWGGCAAHSYKDISLVPDEAFVRVGLEPYRGRSGSSVEARAFAATPSSASSRGQSSNASSKPLSGDADAALDLIERSWAAWINLHDAYRCWYAICSWIS